LEVAEAQHLMDGLDWQGAIKDIQASVKWLKENGSSKVVFYFKKKIFVCLSTVPSYVFLTQILLLVGTKIILVSTRGRNCVLCLFAI
jgi:hypothetical protein